MNMIRLWRGVVSSLRNALFKMSGAMIIPVMLVFGAVKAQGHSTETPAELNGYAFALRAFWL
jgi:hypothetical protein